MNGRPWGHGYWVSTDAGKTEVWLRSLPKVAALLTASGYQVSYSKLWAIQTQRDDLAAGRVNTRKIQPLPRWIRFQVADGPPAPDTPLRNQDAPLRNQDAPLRNQDAPSHPAQPRCTPVQPGCAGAQPGCAANPRVAYRATLGAVGCVIFIVSRVILHLLKILQEGTIVPRLCLDRHTLGQVP